MVCPPFALITAFIRFCRLLTKLLQVVGSVFCHSSWSLASNSFFGEHLCILTLFPKWDHKVSMGFRSEDWGGHFITVIPFFSNQPIETFDVWHGALSCWKITSLGMLLLSQRGSVNLVQHVSINCGVHSALTCVQHSSAWKSHAAPKQYASSSKFYSWNHTIRMKCRSFPTANINRSKGAKNLMKKKNLWQFLNKCYGCVFTYKFQLLHPKCRK